MTTIGGHICELLLKRSHLPSLSDGLEGTLRSCLDSKLMMHDGAAVKVCQKSTCTNRQGCQMGLLLHSTSSILQLFTQSIIPTRLDYLLTTRYCIPSYLFMYLFQIVHSAVNVTLLLLIRPKMIIFGTFTFAAPERTNVPQYKCPYFAFYMATLCAYQTFFAIWF